MLFSDDGVEEPVGVFYQRWSKLADHMLAAPDLNMYLCVTNTRSQGVQGFEKHQTLSLNGVGIFPLRNKKCSCELVDTETLGYSCSTKPPNTRMPYTGP